MFRYLRSKSYSTEQAQYSMHEVQKAKFTKNYENTYKFREIFHNLEIVIDSIKSFLCIQNVMSEILKTTVSLICYFL